jgi:hypothetical protein
MVFLDIFSSSPTMITLSVLISPRKGKVVVVINLPGHVGAAPNSVGCSSQLCSLGRSWAVFVFPVPVSSFFFFKVW